MEKPIGTIWLSLLEPLTNLDEEARGNVNARAGRLGFDRGRGTIDNRIIPERISDHVVGTKCERQR